MARRTTARPGPAKADARPGDIDEGGELVRKDDVKVVKDEPEAITVVHADEAPAAERKPAAKQIDQDDIAKQLADMKRELDAERRAKADAEVRVQAAEARAQQETGRAANNEDAAFRNHKTSVENAVAAAQSERDSAEARAVQLIEAGNFADAVKQQTAAAVATMKLENLAAEQARIKAWEERPRVEQPAPQQQRQAATPREAVDVRSMPRAARDYLDDHPEMLDDWRTWNRLTRAHQDAIDDKVEPYSEEYFERYIHPRMGTGGDEPPARRVSPTRQGDGAVPPSRSGPSTGTRNSSEVRLTARQVEAAHFSFPELDPQEAEIEYARNLRKLESEDRLGTKH